MSVSIVKTANYDEDQIDASFRRAMLALGYNEDDPFAKIIHPGQTVFMKPNWVAHQYRASCPKQYDVFSTITHPAVIKVIARYVDRALMGDGKLIIGDNPSIDADFDQLLKVQSLDDLISDLSCDLSILDLRPLVCKDLAHYGKKDLMKKQTGDPKGIHEINLGEDSMLLGINPRLFRGVFDEQNQTIAAHNGRKHLYGFSKTIFDADVYISVPKLKTHHKVGTTLNLKGLVGTIGIKNHLVHWRNGFPLIGGDAYPNFWKWFSDKFAPVKKRGAWMGNDTIWRMVVDLYKGIQKGPGTVFTIIDGIMGGQRNGPFCPEPIDSRVLIAGDNLLETDLAATHLMGFDVSKIRYLNYFLQDKQVQPDEINVISEFGESDTFFYRDSPSLNFRPPDGWETIKRG